jgi:predicted nuclease of predicted toxin-antitoxin system
MSLLLDECLSAAAAADLRAAGHDAVHVTEVGLGGAADHAVMAYAAAERRVLLSADTDFGELLATSKDGTPSIVLFRGRATPTGRVRVLLDNLDQIADELLAGAVVVIGRDRIRVRRLPIT